MVTYLAEVKLLFIDFMRVPMLKNVVFKANTFW